MTPINQQNTGQYNFGTGNLAPASSGNPAWGQLLTLLSRSGQNGQNGNNGSIQPTGPTASSGPSAADVDDPQYALANSAARSAGYNSNQASGYQFGSPNQPASGSSY